MNDGETQRLEPINSSRQDYLLAIYRLSEPRESMGGRGFATNKEIAGYFDISKASVSEMVRKLLDDGLVELNVTKISLTAVGLQVAEKLLSTHRLWECFLREKLHISEEELHYQADLLEHVTDNKLRDALNRFLDYPRSSPSGKRIFLNCEAVPARRMSELKSFYRFSEVDPDTDTVAVSESEPKQ